VVRVLAANGFGSCRWIRRFRLEDVDRIFWQCDNYAPVLSLYVLAEGLRFFLAFAHRACAALLASSFLSCGVSAAMRVFPPLPPAAFPPFLPISRITLEIRSRLISSSYEEWGLVATFWALTRTVWFVILNATCASGMKFVLYALFRLSQNGTRRCLNTERAPNQGRLS
jgi:hypothetical protein